MSQVYLVLVAPTHVGMARLSWPWWLITYKDGSPNAHLHMVTHPSTNQARC